MGTREFSRTHRVGEQIKRELAPLVQVLGSEQGFGMVSLTGADVSPDLRTAKIYVTQLATNESPDNLLEALEKAAGRLRHSLSRKLRLRTIPRLQFAFDDSLLRGAQISSLLKELDVSVDSDIRAADPANDATRD